MSVSIANGIATFTGTGALTGAAAQLGGATSAVIVGYTSLGSKAFMGASGLTSITIPSSVTTIGPEGLHSTGLRSIELPSSVTSIQDAAFFGSSLTSIIIPSSVNSIAGNAFSYSGLTSATFPNSASVVARGLTVTTSPQYFFGKNGVTIIVSDTKVFTGTGTLTNATSQLEGKAIVRIDGYSSIDENAFQDASGLTFITIPSTVKSIGENAFQGSGVTTATFQTRASVVAFGFTITLSTQTFFGKSNVLVTALDTKIFNGSGSLTGATAQLSGATHAIIQGYTSIGTSAFIGAGITSIDIQSAVTSIGADVFQWTALKSITFPSSVTSIGDRCFTNSGSLTSITILSSVFSIGFAAFQNSGLTTATLPTSALVTALGLIATSSPQTFFFKNGVTVIADDTKVFTGTGTGTLTNATSQLSGKTSVVIEGYSSIDANAFQDASGVTSVTIPSSVTSIGADAFLGSGLTNATFAVRTYFSTFGLTLTLSAQSFFGKSNVVVTSNDTKIFSGTGNLTGATGQLGGASNVIIQGYSSIGTNAFYGAGVMTSVTIPLTVTTIGIQAFNSTGLRTIEIPSSVTSIQDAAFWGSSLTSIIIPSSVNSISGNAFTNSALTTAIFPNGASILARGLTFTSSVQSFFGKNGVTVIADDTTVFTGTGTLTNATSQLSGKTSVLIEGYSIIDANAFQDASGVTIVTIPSSVTSIGADAFQGSGLTNATFAVRTYFSTFGLTLTISPQSFFGKSNVVVTSRDTKIFNGTGPLNDGNGQLGGATNAIIQGYSSIGTNAFRLSQITSVTISSSVTTIGNGSFSETYPLRLVEIEMISSLLVSIGDGAFYGSGLTSITIPSTVTSIVSNAFTNSGLTRATFQTSASIVARGLTLTSSPQSFFGKNGVTVIADDTKVFTGTGTLTNATSQLSGKTNVRIEGYSIIDANAFQDASGVTIVTIPSSVTSIGSSAFQGMTGLTSVTIPSSVTSIGADAFQGSGLTTATFPTRASVVALGLTVTVSTQTFFGKSNVVVTASDTKIFNGSGSLTGATSQLSGATHAIIQGYTSIGGNAFQNASGLTSIDIQSVVTSIGNDAFTGSGLKSMTFPSSVTSIGDRSFQNSSGLTSITILSSVFSIGLNAFQNTALTTATFPNSASIVARGLTLTSSPQSFFGKSNVTVIADDTKVFTGTGTLTNATSQLSGKTSVLIEGYSSIGASAFQDASGVTIVTIPSSVTSIGENAFQGSGLTTARFAVGTYFSTFGLTFTDSVQSFFGKSDVLVIALNTKVFNGSGSLTGATSQLSGATHAIIQGYTSIGNNAFTGAGITSIDIQSAVTSIGHDAFTWTGLKSITFPSSVTSIGDRCFQNSSGLTSITINSSVFSIGGGGAFSNTGLTTATFSTRTSVIALGLTITASTQSFFGKNGVTVIADDTKVFTGTGTLTNATSQLSGKAIVVIEGYSSIGTSAFQDASGVTSVIIPSSVTSIVSNAFTNSGLTTATFPTRASVVALGFTITLSTQTFFGKSNVLVTASDTKIFNGSGSLTGATAQLSGATHAIIQGYTSIGDSAFIGAGITSIDIQSAVTSIGVSAFWGSGLKSIIIPSSVTRLNDYVFNYSGGLTSVTIPASVTGIGSGIFANTALTTAIFVKSSNLSVFNVSVGSGQNISGRSNVTVSIISKVFNGSGALTNATSNLQGATNAEITGYSSIGANAFQDASGVTSVTILASVTSIGADAFLSSGVTTAAFAVSTYFSTFGLTITESPQSFFGKTNVVVTTLDTKIFDGSGELTGATAQLGGATNVIIKGYSSIGQNAFQNATGLKSITIPTTVTNIWNSAFSDSGLTSLLIPASVISFGQGIVWNTNNLKTITFAPNSLLTQIGYRVFMNATGVTSINIPNGVTLIERDAFRSASSLTSIAIPSSVTSIDSTAFEQSGLTTATFPTSSSFATLGLTSTASTQSFFGKTGVTVVSLDTKIFSGTGPLTNATSQLNGATNVIIQGYSSIGNNTFQDASGVTSITIPSSVTSIGASSFQGMSGLTSITIPSSITSIGANAFQGMSGLTSVTIPSAVTSIGSDAFIGSGVTTATFVVSTYFSTFDLTITDSPQPFFGKSNVVVTTLDTKVFNDIGELNGATAQLGGATNVIIQGYSSIGNNAFKDAIGVTYIIIPSSVTSIGSSAFQGATGLKSITIPSSVTSIGSSAFQGATGITSVTIPSSMTSIGTSVFQDATGLTSVTIPSSVKSIGESAFQGATGLTSITIPSSVTSIGGSAFTSSGLTTATFSTRTSVIALGLTITASTQSFFGKTGVTVIALDTKIFSGTGPLTNATSQLNGKAIVRIEGYSSIGANAFQDASGITSITIQATVTSIGESAFKNATGLTIITLPSSIDSIGETAFQGANGLTYVTIPSAVTMIGASAFQSASNITAFFVNSSNNNYSVDSYGALFNIDKTIMIQYPLGNTSTSIIIPNTVTSIGESTFQGATGLTSVTVPSSVSSIGSNAFLSSGITSAIFEESTLLDGLSPSIIPGSGKTLYGKSGINVSWLTKVFNGSGSLTGATALLYGATSVRIATYSSIGANAFQDANGLTSLTIPYSVTSIGASAFKGVTGLSSITIPSSIISIESDAFGYSSLTSITIPSSVTSIGLSAFQDMPYLPEITVDPANTYYSSDNGVLFNTDKTILLQYPNGNPRTLYNIPDSVTMIGNSAFLRATSLTSMIIPSSVSILQDYSFLGMTGITSITIPSSVTSIGNYAFLHSGITVAVFEESILLDGLGMTPGTNTLYGASEVNVSWITKVFNGSGALSYAAGSLYGATNVRIETHSSIGEYAFNGASTVTSITIPSSVTSIGDWALGNATALTSLSISSSVTSIGDNSFYNTASLLQITVDVNNNTYKSDTYGVLFNKTQKTIIQYPAGNASTSYEIPSSVTSLGIHAFQGALALTSITLPASAKSIGATAFEDSGLTTALVDSALYVDDIGLSAGDLVTGYTVPLFFGKSSVTVRYNDAKLAFIEAAPLAIISDNTFISLLTSLAVNISNITSEIVPLTNDPYVEYSATLTIPNGNLSTLSDVNKANIIDNVKALYAAQLGVSINKVIVTLSSGSIIINVDILKDGITEAIVPICFPKGTPVTTNQGDIAIENLNPDIHTIRGKKIVAITQTRPLHKYIISIEKDALGKNVPSAPIQISKEHKVFYKGEMVKANELVEVCEGVTRIPYNGETLYNVLMEKHDKMMINNVICETLDPKNIMAKICGGKYNRVEQANICKELNDIIKADNIPAYKKLYASLK